MAREDGEHGKDGSDKSGEHSQHMPEKKRRMVASSTVKAMVFIKDSHAHAISDDALVKWRREVQTARDKCVDEMMQAGKELAQSCKDTGLQTPVDISDWLQRRSDDSPQ